MSKIIYCSKEQAINLLKTYFASKPVITHVSKRDGIYFITAKTIPRLLHTEWQYRGTVTDGKACFGQLYKGYNRYDFSYGYPEELMEPLNNACRTVIEKYDKEGCNSFLNKGIQEFKAVLKSIGKMI